jgi:hypothetical protein
VGTHDLPLAAFLAGELDPHAARAVDRHLLACEDCWQAVREDRLGRQAAARLRESADPDLADRIRLSVELAPPPQPAGRHRGRAARRTSAAAAAVLIAVTLALGTTRHHPPRDPAAISEVVALAEQQPAPPSDAPPGEGATQSGPPVTVQADGTAIVVRTYAFHGHRDLVATSPRAFPIATGARMVGDEPMAWAAHRGAVTVYCPRATVLLAGPADASELAALAEQLHLS